MNIAIYARVSTDKQDTENQISKLKEYIQLRDWQLENIYTDIITGKKKERPGLNEMLKNVKSGKINGVLVWKLDRLARSVKDAIDISDFLRRHNCQLIIYGSNIDTTTAEGRFFFHIVASFAELEASWISERTRLAYERKRKHAKALGKTVRWGRKKIKLPDDDLERIKELRKQGMSWRNIAKELNYSYSTLRRLYIERLYVEVMQ